MGAPGYTYPNGLFNEDRIIPTASSPPPPYHIVVANTPRRASSSYPQGQSPPMLTAFQTHQHGTQLQGHVVSSSPTSAYAVLASEMAGSQGQVYHHFVQVPYPRTVYSPPVPPGFPPPLSPPAPTLSPHQASAHLVPQPSPTHTGRDPDSATVVSSSIQPTPHVPAQQLISVSTSAPISTTTATNSAEPSWTLEQDRLVLRHNKAERKSHREISIALEDVFHVKRDANSVKERLKHLRARSKAWSEDQLQEAIQKAMQQLSPVLQEELAQVSAIPNAASLTSSPADQAQLASLRLEVRLKLDDMVGRGNLASDMEQKLLGEQRKRSARYTAVMRWTDRVDGDVDATGEQAEDYEIL